MQAATEGITLNNPIIVADETMNAGQKVTYDCIWFGSYPQTEIICEDSYVTKELLDNYIKSGYKIEYDTVTGEMFMRLENAKYDTNDETVIDGIRYIRVKSEDKYRYFRYDKIKWRVLNNDGDKILILADRILDAKVFGQNSSCVWSNSDVRNWLNGNGAFLNYNFMDRAFSTLEQRVIREEWIENNR